MFPQWCWAVRLVFSTPSAGAQGHSETRHSAHPDSSWSPSWDLRMAECTVHPRHQGGLEGQSGSAHKVLTAVSLPWKLFFKEVRFTAFCKSYSCLLKIQNPEKRIKTTWNPTTINILMNILLILCVSPT